MNAIDTNVLVYAIDFHEPVKRSLESAGYSLHDDVTLASSL